MIISKQIVVPEVSFFVGNPVYKGIPYIGALADCAPYVYICLMLCTPWSAVVVSLLFKQSQLVSSAYSI